jgi:glycogen synthase
MNILLCSVPFYPSVGGIESVSAVLAEQFQRMGHVVTVVTQTPHGEADRWPYTVLRRPGAAQLMAAVRAADVVLHNSISLRLAWPLLLLRRPWVVAHHMWLPRRGAGVMAARIKRAALGLAHNVAVSEPVARDLAVPCTVIPNPYDSHLFRRLPGIERERDIAFVGRLVSDKGVPVLLQALHMLRGRGHEPTLSIVGSGPDEPALRAQVDALGLHGQVQFAGRVTGEALVRLLHAHRTVVVPSVWEEPFGLVALEAQACGCTPVVAASGGLPEAAGPAAVVFPKGDATALAACLFTLTGAAASACAAAMQAGPYVLRHLERHQPERVATAYLAVLEDVRCKPSPLARAA